MSLLLILFVLSSIATVPGWVWLLAWCRFIFILLVGLATSN